MNSSKLYAILAACIEIAIHLCLATRDLVQKCSCRELTASSNETSIYLTSERPNYTELLTFLWQPSKIFYINDETYASNLCDLISILSMLLLICAVIMEYKLLAWPWYFKIFAELAVGLYFTAVLFSVLFAAPLVTYSMCVLIVCKIFIFCTILAGLIKRCGRSQESTKIQPVDSVDI